MDGDHRLASLDGDAMIMRALIFGCIALGVALILLMFQATSNTAFFARYTTWLYGVGFALTAGLLVVIGFQIFRLWQKLRHRVFGAKLTLRLMVVLALMAVIPGSLVYAISVQFIQRSIDSWFDVPVDKAMEGALKLGKSALDASLGELTRKAREAAYAISEGTAPAFNAVREAKSRYGFDEAALFEADGKLAALAGGPARLVPERPTAAEIKQALQGGAVRSAEAVADKTLLLRVVVPVAARSAFDAPQVLQAIAPAPANLASDMQVVEEGVREFRQLGLQRQGLKQLFALTLTLAMLLTLFSAISLSLLLSERLSAPLSALAESTRAIAKGDFTKLNPVTSRDEFGVLTQSFNTMTRQLAEASEVVARKQHELENSKAYLESILGNLTSGVITLDERLHVRTINSVAQAMLGFEAYHLRHVRFSDWGEQAPMLMPMVEGVAPELAALRDKPWQRQVGIESGDGKPARTILIRGTHLPAAIDAGYVLVLDDISDLIQAQRDAAWGEVARRLAHEIKNPLTPIQLSAERLERKLADKLDFADRDMLARATGTIVAQVGSLKNMVDDFSLYSHSSRQRPFVALDLNALIREVLVLYESTGAILRTDFDAHLPSVMGDASSLRQVLHNLMRNALDALAGLNDPVIALSTRTQGGEIVLAVADNGTGIREDILPKIFEPYVTSKAKGTGLGLAIVKKIIEEHGGAVRLFNAAGKGATAEIVLPAANHHGRES
jgi:nitrogen fixation/metabolism regulation signal transduction histidine kinase